MRSSKHPVRAPRNQQGYIVLLVAVFLLLLSVYAMNFLDNVAFALRDVTVARDNIESRLLAESAMNKLAGQFSNTLDTDADNTPDYVAAADLQINMADSAALTGLLPNFPYIFICSAGAGIDQLEPMVLQRVANGEAAGLASDVDRIESQVLSTAVTQLRINDLFDEDSAAFRPKLYTVDANGLLVESAAADWNSIAGERAAAWVELTRNPVNANAVDIFVAAVAEVDQSKRYIQRYINTYQPSLALGNISILSESSENR